MFKKAIEIIGLTKAFHAGNGLNDWILGRRGKRIVALDKIDLEIHSGEMAALTGPNGAGKTTLLRILAGLILPDTGTVNVSGEVNLVLNEDRTFYPRLTGRQNLEFFAALHNLFGMKARLRIAQARGLFEIEDLDKRFQEYSTGNKQRLALARSFLHDAPILLLDEPTRSLDAAAASHLRSLIREVFNRQSLKTVLFTTHHLEEAEYLADRILYLEQGRLKENGLSKSYPENLGVLETRPLRKSEL